MIDPSLTPSRQLRILSRIARWSLGLVLAFWLLLAAVWGTLHGFIVPRIGDWRVEVERLATQALGAPVRIDVISAQSNGLFPTVHLVGVRVLDAEGRDALTLDSVVATVSARSLLRLGLEQLYVEAAELDIRHLSDGRWQVAGLDLVQSDSTESRALDWLLEQPELVLKKGRLYFTDEQHAVETVEWRDVDVLLRNRHWSHVLSVDATPVSGDDERLQIVGAFRESLLPSSKAPWEDWSGQWYASVHLAQVPELPWPQVFGVQSISGNGLARMWIDVRHGQAVGMTADVALPHVNVNWQDPQTVALDLHNLNGRFEGHRQGQGWRVEGKNFTFQYGDGVLWPSSQWAISAAGPWTAPTSAHLDLEYADLAMASTVAQSLPVPDQLRAALVRWAPQGALRAFKVDWLESGSYQVSGKVSDLWWKAQPAEHGVGIPGVEGLSAAFDFNSEGGTASLGMQAGVLHFPGVFEEPAVPLQALQAQVRWHIHHGRLRVEVEQAQFENEDAQGHLQAVWKMGEQDADRLPGYLQLQGQLERANGGRVHRYLPLEVPEIARHYVRDSVKQGQGRNVEFEVKGNLQDMPFDRPSTGIFLIKAPVSNVVYDFVPPSLHSGQTPYWPALVDLDGTLVFEGASMRVEQAQTGFRGHPQLRMNAVAARIPDLNHPHLTVNAAGQVDLQAALGLVHASPLSVFTSHALDATQAQGPAQIAFDLELPIEHLEAAKVRGHVGFKSNSLQFNANAPPVQLLQGSVQFHEQGFELQHVKGRALGGSVKIEGGMSSLAQGVRINVQGTATAEGMKKDSSIPLLAQIADQASGQATYSVAVTANQGAEKVVVRTDLRGLGLNLPEPLSKAEDAAWDVSVMQQRNAQDVQELRVEVAGRGWVSYEEDVSVSPSQLLRGRIVMGTQPFEKLTGTGVTASIDLPSLDADAWLSVWAAGGAAEIAPASKLWLPQRIQLDVGHLLLHGRELEAVRADVSHVEGVWRGGLKAKHLSGSVEYQEPSGAHPSGHLFARFTHLSIPKAEAQRLNQEAEDAENSAVNSLPALDIEVDRLEIAGKSLGKLQLKASNSVGRFGRDWTLEQFDLTTPEAHWRANGYWGAEARGVPRSTHLSFLLEMDSSGKLLERFGMPEVIRDGQGRLNGKISWQGAPITPQWSSMDGSIHMQVEQGQFLKVEPGAGKLLSVLSLQSLTRRMNLDFRDVFSQGFAFDYVRGDIKVKQGLADTNNLQMKGLNAAVLMEGTASLVDETQVLKVVVVPEINAMTASLAATAINPVIGVGSFVAQMFLRSTLMEAATRTFEITGTWSDPVVEQVRKQASPVPSRPESVKQ